MIAESRGHSIGYARVSTLDQDPALQLDALNEAGCSRIFEDRASGSLATRPELAKALDHLRAGDTLVVWRLDRLGRSLKDLVRIVEDLAEREIGFCSLHESIDTTSPTGKLTFHLFGALAEFERDLIRERTSAGLAAARSRGRIGGRPTVMTPKKLEMAKSMLAAKNADGSSEHTVDDIASTIGVSRATVYRALREKPKSASVKPAT
ncbi:MAG: recombinase family protein [Thermoleophilaceae bacterium]|nr:recombinase family protein [Thermoleophilaceae bacterium]